MDRARGHRAQRAGAGARPLAAGAVPLAAGRFVPRQGDRRVARPVRRARGEGEVVMTTRIAAEPASVTPPSRPKAPPCAVVVFGATGDLTHRKLAPALFKLFASG